MTQLRILLIESDAGMLDHLQHSLGGRGYEVNVVPDGLIGLAELERHPTLPDLILLRVEIPRMSGYTVCNKIKRREKLRGIPLILLASQATPETFAQHKRLRTRADGYLTIPFEDMELLSLIDNVTHGKALSGSFVEVPAVNADGQSVSSASHNAAGPYSTQGPARVGTTPDVHAIRDADEYQLIEEIDENDPMILSVEDLTDDHSQRQRSGHPDLGADSLDALINEEQEMAAQQLRDLWSASLEPAEEDGDDFDRTIVGQKPPISDDDPESTFNGSEPSPHANLAHGSAQSWQAPPVTTDLPGSSPFEPKQSPQDNQGRTSTPARGTNRRSTPAGGTPAGGLDDAVEQMIFERRLTSPEQDHASEVSSPSRELRLDEAIDAQAAEEEVRSSTRRYVESSRGSASRSLDAVSAPPSGSSHSADGIDAVDAEDTGGDDDAIASMLDAHFQDMMELEETESPDALLQQLKQLEEQLEAALREKESQEADFQNQRELWLEQAAASEDGDGPTAAALQMQLAEAQAQIDANQDEKKDLYEEITRLRRTVSELKVAEKEAASLSNVASVDQDEYDALCTQADEQERALRKAEESLVQHKEDLEALQQELDAARLQGDSESVQAGQIQREYEALQRLYNDSEHQVEQNELVVGEMRAQIKDRDADARELRSELAALRVHIQGQMSTDDELLVQMADKEKELQLLREDINQLGESYDQLEKKYQTTLVESERFREELDTRNKALLHLSTGQDELRIAQTRLSEESQKKTERITGLSTRNEELDGEIEALHEELATVAEERNKYRDEVMDLNNDLDAGRAEVRNLQDSEGQLRDRLSEAERQRDHFEHEAEEKTTKLKRTKDSLENLELEVVQLRKQNVALEQQVFDIEEKTQRAEQQRSEFESQFGAEKKGRLDLLKRSDALETELVQLKIEHEKAVEKRDELYTELDSVRGYLEEETSKREDLEYAQASSLNSLASATTEIAALTEQHENELLSLQTDYEQELAVLRDSLEGAAATREAQLLEEGRQTSEAERNELLLRLDRRRNDELTKQAAEYESRLDTITQEQQTQLASLLREHTEELNHIRQESRLETEQVQTELQRQSEKNQAELQRQHEQSHTELQRKHDQMLSQLEEDNRRLRLQLRGQEDEYREQLMLTKDEAKRDLERRLDESQQQTTLRNQAVVDSFEQREAEMERQLRISNRTREDLEQQLERAQQSQLSQKDEFVRLNSRLADVEALREHERGQLKRLEQERDDHVLTLEAKIQQLEKSLQKGISDSAGLYQKLKRHEMRKESTVKALQDALSLLDDGESRPFRGDERDSSPPRPSTTPAPRSTPIPHTPPPSSRTPEHRASDSRPPDDEKQSDKPQFANLESFARKLDF